MINDKEVQIPFRLKAGGPLDIKYGPYDDIAARDAIPTAERYDGMLTYVSDRGDGEPEGYILRGGLTNSSWEAVADMSTSVYDKNRDGIIDDAGALAVKVVNDSGGVLPFVTAVYISGHTPTVLQVKVADNTDPLKKASAIMVTSNLPDGSEGEAVYYGLVFHIDTAAWATGDDLYYNSVGQLTDVKPIIGDNDPIGNVLIGGEVNGLISFDVSLVVDSGGGSGGPAVENRYANVAAMYADQINQVAGGLQFVEDASGDNVVGYAYYDYIGTTNGDRTDYYLLTSGKDAVKEEVFTATAAQTDFVIPGAEANEITNTISVRIGGSSQVETEFTIETTTVDRDTIRFTNGLQEGDEVVVRYFSGSADTSAAGGPSMKVKTITADHLISQRDNGYMIEVDSVSSVTITFPIDLGVGFNAGLNKVNTGDCLLTTAGTMTPKNNIQLASQYDLVMVYVNENNILRASGDIT